MVTKVPGMDNPQAFAETDPVPITDMGQTFRQDAPIVLIDAATGKRQLIWAELDSNAHNDAERELIIRVGKNLLRAYASKYVGEEYVQRPKHGFAVPLPAVFATGALDERLRNDRAESSSTWAQRFAAAARALSRGGPTDANGAWYLLVLLDWCERRGLLDELDVLDGVYPRPRLKAGLS